MGCSTSKLDNAEAVQLCKDRKKFIKQAIEHRMQFASGHIAYVQSIKRVSAALLDYVEEDKPHEFLLDSFSTPPLKTIKKTSLGYISILPKTFSVTPIQSMQNSSFQINYLRSGGNPAVCVEERPLSPETYRVETYSPVHQHRMDGFFALQSPPMGSCSIFHYSPNDRANFPPPSPQTSQWDFFWNPFSSLDCYGYPNRGSLDQTVIDDDINGLRQVQEEKRIPDLEEETDQEKSNHGINMSEGGAKADRNFTREEVTVEDVDDEDDENEETDRVTDCEVEVKELQSHGSQSTELSKVQNGGQVNVQETDKNADDEMPGFTVYVNRRPTSMAEVIKDLEDQFTTVCKAAKEVSAILEASKAQYSMSNELTAMKMLNPAALIRSALAQSSSSRFLMSSSYLKDEGYDSNKDLSFETCMFLGSHQSTLERLYAWEKKLYQEVRAGERVRMAYEKKSAQLNNQDVKGEDSSPADKTRASIRDLRTQIKVSIQSVEAVSKRIETLRDEELQPQLLELVQGLARMWKVMAECHHLQKRTLEEAKILLAVMPSKLSGRKMYTIVSPSEPHWLARSAAKLETELRNLQASFELWVTSQRSYIHALTSWLLCCAHLDPSTSKLPFAPTRSTGVPPIFAICIQWSRFIDTISEVPVLEGLDFFAAGVGSLYARQLQEDSISCHTPGGLKRFGGELLTESGEKMEMVEVGSNIDDEVMTAEKMAEIAIRVFCAGMSVAMSSLTEFARGSAEGYADLVKQLENVHGGVLTAQKGLM